MATVTVNDASLSAIADAIREKLDVETTYLPSQMAAAIESIETGGTDLTSEDEGKVVVESSGEYVLQAQTSLSISQNGTYDTTTKNEVIVNVSGGTPVTSNNDLLFHFNDNMKNTGACNSITLNTTGYELSDEQAKSGTHSLKVSSDPNTTGAVQIDNDFAFGYDDFTIDFWAYPTAYGSGACVFSFTYRSIAYYMSSATSRGVTLASSSSSWAVDHANNQQDTDLSNGWHHIAITREGNVIRTFVDGVKEDEISFSSSIAPTKKLGFGTNSNNSYNWRGYVDEFRVLLGTAVWTEDFTPPTQPYA